MQLRMWTYDLAREQSPDLENLRELCRMTRDSGYNAIGLYLEHRFAFPAAPWAHGLLSLQPETVRTLIAEFPTIQIVPMINLLGHMEGFIYTEEGVQLAESRFEGMQACPSNVDFLRLCDALVDDTLSTFNSEIVHIGGDETWQLGKCPLCAARVNSFESEGVADGKARLYGEHFGRLAQRVVDAGRRPAVWGDMFFDHPSALDFLPTDTLIFDWQYFNSAATTSVLFRQKGFECVFCPAIHTYNATWVHLAQSEENIRENVAGAKQAEAFGVCVTTWECGLFGNYETLLPALRAGGTMIREVPAAEGPAPIEFSREFGDRMPFLRSLTESPFMLQAYLDESERYEEWARLMGIELQHAGGPFAFGGIRNAIKSRLLLYSNPFLLWLRNREEILGSAYPKATDVLDRAASVAPDSPARSIAEFGQHSIQFVEHVESAHQAYAKGHLGEALGELAPCRQIFDNLGLIAKAGHVRFGGSYADIERCRLAKQAIERVMTRIKQYGDGSLGYRPSFEQITHPKFVAGDQAAWWLINRWANE
jgi:hypothetical protein